MNLKPILSSEDYGHLKVIAAGAGRYPLHRESLHLLRRKLEGARVLEPEEIPPDVVTMNSRVHLLDRNEDSVRIWTLVYPDEASTSGGRLSVLAPLGLAVLGCQAGDLVEWPALSGWTRITILKITDQPEAELRRAALSA